MNINVPAQINAEIMNTQMDKAEINQADSLLFSLFLYNSLGRQNGAKEQNTEAVAAEGVNLNKDQELPENLLGQNAYLQILQNLFPAGKEANSGLIGEQNVESISGIGMNAMSKRDGDYPSVETILSGGNTLSAKTILSGGNTLSADLQKLPPQYTADLASQSRMEMQDPVTLMKDMGFERISNLISRENIPLNPVELAQYIKLNEQLQVLSGKIENQEIAAAADSSVRTTYFILEQGIQDRKGNLNQGNRDEYGLIQSTAQVQTSASAEAKGQQGLMLSQEGADQKPADNKLSELHSALTLLNQAQELKGLDKPLTPRDAQAFEAGKIWNQVIDMLKKQDIRNNEVKELSIHLHPAELGKVHISLRLENGQVHLVMNTSEQATGAFLQNHLSELRNSLNQAGVPCGTMEMGHQNDRHSDANREFLSRQSHLQENYQDEEKRPLTMYSAVLAMNGSGSRINVSA